MLLAAGRMVTPARVFAPGWLLVDGDLIAEVGPGQPPREADVALPDAIVVPGFVDIHAHLRVERGEHQQPWSYMANLAYGVTATRDPQTGTTDVLSYEDAVTAGLAIGPRIYSTGPGLFGPTYAPANGDDIKDLDHARRIMRRYSDHYDTKTLKM